MIHSLARTLTRGLWRSAQRLCMQDLISSLSVNRWDHHSAFCTLASERVRNYVGIYFFYELQRAMCSHFCTHFPFKIEGIWAEGSENRFRISVTQFLAYLRYFRWGNINFRLTFFFLFGTFLPHTGSSVNSSYSIGTLIMRGWGVPSLTIAYSNNSHFLSRYSFCIHGDRYSVANCYK